MNFPAYPVLIIGCLALLVTVSSDVIIKNNI